MLLTFNTHIPVSFSLVEASVNLLFSYGRKFCHHNSFNVLNLIFHFQFQKQKKSHKARLHKYLVYFTHTILCFNKNMPFESIKSAKQNILRIETYFSRYYHIFIYISSLKFKAYALILFDHISYMYRIREIHNVSPYHYIYNVCIFNIYQYVHK